MPQNEELRFDGEVVIVTGAGRGLGRQYALLFAERGASVVVNDTGFTPDGSPGDDDVAGAVVAEIRERGGRALADTTDVSIDGGAESIVQAAMDAFGTVSAVVNNAGVITYASFDELTLAQWQRMDEVTMGGAFRMSKAVWPVFKRNAYGRIVNTTSAAGFAGSDFLAHYGAAKLGVAGLTKCLAIEGANSGIKVNAIAPMAVTRMNSEQFFGGAQTPGDDWQDDIRKGVVPIGPPSIVAPTVVWLAHRSTEVSGDVFSTTSGRVARVGFVIGSGYFNPIHRPEDLRDNVEQIRDLSTFIDPVTLNDEGPVIAKLFSTD